MYLTAFHSSAWANKIQIKQNGLYAAIEINVDVTSNTVIIMMDGLFEFQKTACSVGESRWTNDFARVYSWVNRKRLHDNIKCVHGADVRLARAEMWWNCTHVYVLQIGEPVPCACINIKSRANRVTRCKY